MRNARVDQNQKLIVEALRAAGASVWDTHTLGHGFPGLDGKTYLVEVKYHSAPLTDDELSFLRKWRGHYKVIRSVEEALRMIGR
jgi:hypothetical protein